MAMLKNKHLAFSLILVCLIVVSPMAKAQLGGLGGLGINFIVISGRVSCTLNATLNGASAPPFPNATVQLQCGPLNTVVATTTTNVNGIFTFLPNQIPVPLNTLLSSCRVFVATSLASCNARLPLVNLASPLNVVGTLGNGFINIILVGPTGFIPSVPLPIN
ncbi:Phylloplanin [Cardamine amara subsp. amara]|uniref:Phylloplanin n=1 Tax=Cardamine amara subsp. amara TaxID=228776 RepID=A0ABD1C390_CARAN